MQDYLDPAETTEDESFHEALSNGSPEGVDKYIDTVVDPRAGKEEQDVSKPKRRNAKRIGEKIEWSGDDDGSNAYQKFKNRRTLKRKQVAARTQRAKEEADSGAENPERKKRGLKKKTKPNGGREEDLSLLEDSLPDHVQARRNAFDHKLGHSIDTLQLSPDFEEIMFSDDEHLETLAERPAFPKSSGPCAEHKDIKLPYSLGVIPAPIAQWLREYQVKGVAFLHELFVYQKGGILGDDMGLGKTIQVIAFLTAAFGKTGDERDAKRMRKSRRALHKPWYPRVLIICPGSLIDNWKSELETWGWWHVDTFHGDTKEAAIDTAKSGYLEVMITTYTTYRLNHSVINMIDWDCVIADECHIIKSEASEITKIMNDVNALCRIGLTGTAIQNKYEELWTILNWTNPGRFGPLSIWNSTISKPLRIGQSHDATVYELSRARKTASKLVQNLLPEFFLRRMKTLLADQLPSKSDRVVFCPLTDTQRSAYERCLTSELFDLIRSANEPCSCGTLGRKRGWCHHIETSNGLKWSQFVFSAMLNLQKLSNHIALLIPQGTDLKEKQEKDLEILKIALPNQWKDLYRNRDSIINFANTEFCGKWKILKKMLKLWHDNGDKVLVFSHSVRLLKMLNMLFKSTSYNVSYLDGEMAYKDRTKEVNDFNADPAQFVFLISTRAGGVGLNITSANKVVIVDPNWNPAHDQQAQDRAYRIGQIRDVEVFRLVSAGTIEEVVYARQVYKQAQSAIALSASTERRYFRGVQQKSDQKGEIFGLANLFSFRPNGSILRNIINKTNIAEARAGISVVSLDVAMDAADTEEDAMHAAKTETDTYMNQLAAAVVKGNTLEEDGADPTQDDLKKKRAKSDPILAILANAGVEYTHENSEVIGSSTVEKHLSRHAEAAGNELEIGRDPVFERQATTDDAADEVEANLTGPDGTKKPFKYKYNPPEDVKRRQFCSIAKWCGFDDAVEFGHVVEGWTQSQRRGCLDKFYRHRKKVLGIE
ncbi:MAG: hypothetical protein M1814_002747 [Vezdaea aestivalis]|nr:MAG: hypothetical protein M1814_002747 [Vezdaea aestivalis]